MSIGSDGLYHYLYRVDYHGKYYVGRHSTKRVDDGYTGSGVWARNVRKSGGKLTKTYIAFFDNYNDLYEAERTLINEHIDEETCMNFNNSPIGFAVGERNPANSPSEKVRRSERSWTKTDHGRRWFSENNPSKRDDVKKLRSKQIRKQWENPVIRDAWTGSNHWTCRENESGLNFRKRMTENNPMHNKEIVEKNKEKVSSTVKQMWESGHYSKSKAIKTYAIFFSDGKVEIHRNLSEWCKNNDINYKSLRTNKKITNTPFGPIRIEVVQ